MSFTFDHDLHIHSNISHCSNHPDQIPEKILQYAVDKNLKTICLTNHFWDENVPGASPTYMKQNFDIISQAKPLPTHDKVRFLFGCEAEYKSYGNKYILALSEKRFDEFDFIIIPTTHYHLYLSLDEKNPETKTNLWIDKFNKLLDMDLPFHKIGIAHLACRLMAPDKETYSEVLRTIPQDEMTAVFKKAAELGVGIEINASDMKFSDEEADDVLRIFKTAKNCGCKFYFGSDAHDPARFDEAEFYFKKAVRLLDLTEDDKYDFNKL